MRWTEEHPGAGNMNEIATFASRLRNRIDAIDRVGTTLHAARTEADSVVFAGAAGDAWRSSVDPLVTSLATLHQHLSTMETAAQTYRSGVAAIAASDADLNRRLASKRATRDALAMHGGSVVGVEQRIDALNDSIAALKLSLHALASQRKALDDAFCAALQPPAGLNNARYRAMVATYGASAFTGNLATFFTARDQKVAEYTELATKIASGDASQVEITKLTTFLTNSATDPALASAFWLSVGGDTTSALLSELALDTEPSNIEALGVLARTTESIRESLSVGSATWDQDQAALFAAGLFLSLPARQYGLDAISYLFNNPQGSPMGANLTLSVATEFDSWERDPRYGNPGAILLDRPAVTPLGQLMFLENESLGDWDTAGNDPMARVFETLALYPNEALAFLSDPTPDPYWDPDNGGVAPSTGNARIEYWYGQREWEYDGWSGVAALWEGSMHADGGFLEGPPNTATWDTQCDTYARVITSLDQGLSGLRPGDLPEAASLSFGTALADLMPMASESVWSYDAGDVDPRGSELLIDADRLVPGFENPVNIPFFDHGALGRVIGQVSSTDTGFAVLRAATTEVENRLLASAEESGTYAVWDANLSKIYTLEANFDGAVGGASILQGQFDDAVVKAKISVMSDLISLIPGPKVEGPAGVAVGFVDGKVRSGLLGMFEDSVVINEQLAINLTEVDVLLGRSLLDSEMSRLAADPGSTLSTVVVPREVDTYDSWFNSFGTHYEAFYEQKLWNGS